MTVDDPFLAGAHPSILLNTVNRVLVERTVGAVLERLPLWDRPEAFLELTESPWDEMPLVMVKWWRRAAQTMTDAEAAAARVREAESGTLLAVDLPERFVATLDAARREYQALGPQERRDRHRRLLEEKRERYEQRAGLSERYLDVLGRLADRERAYMEALRIDLEAGR